MSSKNKEIDHIKCGLCSKVITHLEDDEIIADTHFDIIRSNKDYSIDSGGEIICEDENVKMELIVCEECFLKILNGSKILGDHFYDVKTNKFVY
jgi:hypothetical protein